MPSTAARCHHNVVEVHDGGTANSPLLGAFCGRTRPSTLTSTGNVLYVRFRTDGSIQRRGFKATYKIGEWVWVG